MSVNNEVVSFVQAKVHTEDIRENGRRDNVAIPTLPPWFQADSPLSCGMLKDSLINGFHVRSLSKGIRRCREDCRS